MASVPPVANAQTIPLPFDTVGANRGNIPIGVVKDFMHTFTLGPGQRWLFERTVAVKEIVAAMGPGRAYFLAHIVGVPGYRTALSAGDLELR